MKLMMALALAAGILAAEDAKKEDAGKLTREQQLTLQNMDLRFRLASAEVQRVIAEFNAQRAAVCAEHKIALAQCDVNIEAGTVTKRPEAAKKEEAKK